MIDQELLAMLRCPADGSPLELVADETVSEVNARIESGTARDVSDQLVQEPIEGGLRPVGGSILYPIRRRIPTLVVDEAIRLESS